MSCGCGKKKLPASDKTSSKPATNVKANPFPPSYFWNGPQAKKT